MKMALKSHVYLSLWKSREGAGGGEFVEWKMVRHVLTCAECQVELSPSAVSTVTDGQC